jgi:protein TonB
MADEARPISQPQKQGDPQIILDPGYRFLAAAGEIRVSPRDRAAGSVAVSLLAHAAVCVVAIIVAGRTPVSPSPAARPPAAMPLVWTPTFDPGGGDPGGGGKKDERTPATPGQLEGRDVLTVPVSPSVQLDTPKPQIADPAPRLDIPVMPVQSGVQEVVGAVAELRPMEPPSRGPGAGPGADGGRGRGIDGGDGNRLGDTDGPGTGEGDGWRPGNGVTWPRLVREVKPNYTPDAMRAQVEGMVELDILVLADGSVGRVNIVRSLDTRFGLDQEAINAVRRWRFDPGRRLGKAVATRVAVELSFNLR